MLASGCSPAFLFPLFGKKQLHLNEGQIAKIAKPARVEVMYLERETKKWKIGYVDAQYGWMVGPPPSAIFKDNNIEM